MRQIDLQTWARRDHFTEFTTWDYPQWSLCANVDLTAFHAAVKEHGAHVTAAIMYVVTRAANAIPEFRQRIRDGFAVEHEVVHPSITVLGTDDLFGFCHVGYDEDFPAFAARAVESMAHVRENPTMDDPDRDDCLYMTAIPWVSFTSFMHPLRLYPADSVPRFAWGKFFEEGGSLKMPLSVQGHHAVMDGLHVGRYYAELQALLDWPEDYLGGA